MLTNTFDYRYLWIERNRPGYGSAAHATLFLPAGPPGHSINAPRFSPYVRLKVKMLWSRAMPVDRLVAH
jgi:hypothetical protein